MRSPALLILSMSLLLPGPAAAIDQDVPAPFVPATALYQDLAADRPGARLAYQLDALKSDLSRALQAYGGYFNRAPATWEELEAAQLLPFLPTDDTGQPLHFVEATMEQLPGTGTIGVIVRADEITLIARGADGDPEAPLLVAQRQFSANSHRIHGDTALADVRLDLANHAILLRLDHYQRLSGQPPPTWQSVLNTLHWTPSPMLTPTGPQLTITGDPRTGVLIASREHSSAGSIQEGLGGLPGISSWHPAPWFLLDIATSRPELVTYSVLATGPPPTPPIPMPAGHFTNRSGPPAGQHIAATELRALLLRFVVAEGSFPSQETLEPLLFTQVFHEGQPMPVLRMPDAPITLDPGAMGSLLTHPTPAVTWISDGSAMAIGIPPYGLQMGYRPNSHSGSSAFPAPLHYQTQAVYAAAAFVHRPHKNAQGLPHFGEPSTAWPAAVQQAWTEYWLADSPELDAIRLQAFAKGIHLRLQWSTQLELQPDSWATLDAALELEPRSYREIASLDALPEGGMGVGVEVDASGLLWRCTVQIPNGLRHVQILRCDSLNFNGMNLVLDSPFATPEFAHLDFQPFATLMLDPLE